MKGDLKSIVHPNGKYAGAGETCMFVVHTM